MSRLVFRSRACPSLISRPVIKVEELETLWKLQEEELNRLSEGDWQADKEKCQERLATISSDKQNLEAEIEEIKSNKNAIQERYQNLQEQVAQARLLKTELQGQKTL